MNPIPRRRFFRQAALTAATLAAPTVRPAQGAATQQASPAVVSSGEPGIVDTNVNLLEWPFRRLKHGDTRALVAKLRRHAIKQAWAGSYEALLHKNLEGVNARLAEECARHGEGLLVPFGSVNLAWPDWEEDLRRCHEVHRMPGIRLFLGYQPFDFAHPDFPRLLRQVADRNLVLQICLQMEDERIVHPSMIVPPLNTAGVLSLLRGEPRARVQFLHWGDFFRSANQLARLIAETSAVWDISNLEGNGAVGRIFAGNHWYLRATMPIDRLLFGSHAPYFPVEGAVLKLFESPLDQAQLDALMETNARRLLGRTA